MSELFGKDVSGHVMSRNIMKEDFGWEVPVEAVPLPSRGVIYNPDTTLYNRETINIKSMTAHEEDILASQALIKDGTVMTKLIESCVSDRTFDVDSMINGDRNALMVAIRVTGYGTSYKIKAKCENCSHLNKVDVDLATLAIKRLNIKPVEAGANKFLFELPVTKKKVLFKFLTPKDEKQRSISRNFMKKFEGGIDNGITSILEHSIISIEGITDRSKIKHFVKYMPAYDSKSLRNFIKENEPGIDMSCDFQCTNCSHTTKTNLPVTTEFFWPST